MATDRTSLTLTDERRRLEDRARTKIDDLPDVQFRTTLYDLALTHLIESIDNMEQFDGDPQLAKQFSTSVVRPKYRTWVDVERP